MESGKPLTWLDKLEEQLNVDVDWMDPEYIKGLPFKPHDQTSNQLWVDIQLGHESNRELLLQTAKELKGEGWLAVYNRMSCLMCKQNIDLIRGRVLLQTLPSSAYSTEKTVEHALQYDREFARAGIGRDRYCVKIPATGPALKAAETLSEQGIATLGTALFGLPQAIACGQAGCKYVSPYFNEVRAHEDRSLWEDVEDPATQHPMSARVLGMLETYRRLYKETGKEQPLLKNASFISVKEAMAAGELGCHSATFSPAILDALAGLPYDGTKQPGRAVAKPAHVYRLPNPTPERLGHLAATDPLAAAAGYDSRLADTDVDYLAGRGERLDEAIAADPVATARLEDALRLFTAAEERSRARIEEAMKLV